MNEFVDDQIQQALESANSLLVVSHIRPDGDAIGSLLGLGLALREIGKEVQMVSADGVPAAYQHLPGGDLVIKHPKGTFDMVIVLDCSDLKRVGNALNGYHAPDVNIDHHVTNLNFAKYNLVDKKAVATTEILAVNFSKWNLPITQSIATVLLTGLLTDTLGFRTSNMTPQALRVAADLMELGADMPELYSQVLIQRSYEAVRFWGRGLTNINRDGSIIWTSLTLEDRKSAGYSGRDDADLINVLSSINDALIAIIFVEQPKGGIKVSWRAQPGYDISHIAQFFGGGGHPAAAGAEIPGSVGDVIGDVLQKTTEYLDSVEQTK
jgi:phosphoesterase RecJ-like protein